MTDEHLPAVVRVLRAKERIDSGNGLRAGSRFCGSRTKTAPCAQEERNAKPLRELGALGGCEEPAQKWTQLPLAYGLTESAHDQCERPVLVQMTSGRASSHCVRIVSHVLGVSVLRLGNDTARQAAPDGTRGIDQQQNPPRYACPTRRFAPPPRPSIISFAIFGGTGS